jgi:hypothetical protein
MDFIYNFDINIDSVPKSSDKSKCNTTTEIYEIVN